jgi:hypothetical protein
MWRCPFNLLSVNNYWYLCTVLHILSNFLLCKNGIGKISQNFAKLNSLPKFLEIRTYKFREKRWWEDLAEFREIKFLAEISRNSYL